MLHRSNHRCVAQILLPLCLKLLPQAFPHQTSMSEMSTTRPSGLHPSSRRPCKSFVKRKQKSPDARYGGARKNQHIQNPQLATCASRRWFLPVRRTGHPFAVSGPEGPSQKIEFVFAASPETIRGSLGSLRSFAQSATCGTWQPARRVILISLFLLPRRF